MTTDGTKRWWFKSARNKKNKNGQERIQRCQRRRGENARSSGPTDGKRPRQGRRHRRGGLAASESGFKGGGGVLKAERHNYSGMAKLDGMEAASAIVSMLIAMRGPSPSVGMSEFQLGGRVAGGRRKAAEVGVANPSAGDTACDK